MLGQEDKFQLNKCKMIPSLNSRLQNTCPHCQGCDNLVTPSSSTGWAGESSAVAISSSEINANSGFRQIGQRESRCRLNQARHPNYHWGVPCPRPITSVSVSLGRFLSSSATCLKITSELYFESNTRPSYENVSWPTGREEAIWSRSRCTFSTMSSIDKFMAAISLGEGGLSRVERKFRSSIVDLGRVHMAHDASVVCREKIVARVSNLNRIIHEDWSQIGERGEHT